MQSHNRRNLYSALSGLKNKSHAIYEEIDSDGEHASTAPSGKGILRDLDPNTIIPTPSIPRSVETLNALPPSSTRTTRASRNGKSSANYDMKYHPMDRVTRPKRTAKRHPELFSAELSSLSVEIETEHQSTETSDTSEAEAGGSESDSDVETNIKCSVVALSTWHAPDPRATRQSRRTEAKKPVLYNTKVHPQDLDLPGYRSKARALRDEQSSVAASRKRKRGYCACRSASSRRFRNRAKGYRSTSARISAHVHDSHKDGEETGMDEEEEKEGIIESENVNYDPGKDGQIDEDDLCLQYDVDDARGTDEDFATRGDEEDDAASMFAKYIADSDAEEYHDLHSNQVDDIVSLFEKDVAEHSGPDKLQSPSSSGLQSAALLDKQPAGHEWDGADSLVVSLTTKVHDQGSLMSRFRAVYAPSYIVPAVSRV